MARGYVGALMVSAALLGAGHAAHAQSSSTAEVAQDGTLIVSCATPGAQVYIDDVLVGPAPVTRDLPAGSHTVRVAADNFDPFVRRVVVRGGVKNDVTAKLSPGVGTVEFKANAPDAVLILAGKQEYPLPVRLTAAELSYGRYTYEIRAPRREPISGVIDFTQGKNIFVLGELESGRGLVQITSQPSGATVFLDGESVGSTPLSLEGVAAAPHLVRLELDGHATVFRELDTSAGYKGELEARLPEEGARLRVKTGIDAAEVWLEGQRVGTGSVVTLPMLERGLYEIHVTAPDQKPASTRIDVPPQGKITYAVEFETPSARSASRLVDVPPLHQRWTFWTATGAGAVALTAGSVILWNVLQPDAAPPGDVVVTLP